MKILIVSPYYPPYCSGVTVYVARLAEGLVVRGHSVCVLTARHDRHLPGREVVNGVDVRRIPALFGLSKGKFKPMLLPTISRVAKDFDVVNVHAPLFEAGAVLGLLREKRPILTYHCDLALHDPLGQVIERAYYGLLHLGMGSCHRIVCHGHEYAGHSRISYAIDKVVPIPPPITPFAPVKDSSYLRRRWGIKDGPPVIGFLGRLVREKGLAYLVDAIPHIRREVPGAVFVIAGEGEHVAGGKRQSVLEALKRRTEGLRGVVFPGHVPAEDLEAFYSLCDVFVLPSCASLESFGMVQVEAMLCGTPVVASDLPGVREPIKKTGMGVLVPPRNAKALAEGIVDVLTHPRRYAVFPKAIQKTYGLKHALDGYERLFASIAVHGKKDPAQGA